MAAYTSFGTRKALGKRYSVDPALQLEAERLQQEYNLAPGREARALQAEQFQQNLDYMKERDAGTEKGSMVGTGLNALTTGLTLYKLGGGELGSIYPAIKSGVTSAYNGVSGMFGGGAAAPATTTGITGAAPATVAPALVDSASGAGGGAATGMTGGTAAADAALTADAGGMVVEGGSGAIGAAAGEAGGATLGSIAGGAASAGPYIAAWKLGMPYLRDIMQTGTRDLTGAEPDSSNTLAQMNRIAGSARGVVAPAYEEISGNKMPEVVEGVLNPAGYIFGNKLGCIIITACTDRYSPEVNLARKYRDRFLDEDQLRGYYALAEKIVPILERNERCRKNVKKWLVDRLVDYGAYRLGTNMARPRWSSYIVSRAFLATIKTIGMILPVYVRVNGEVY